MSETREQFRGRLADAAWEGMRNSKHEDGTGGQQIDGFQSVYAQALRDVISHLDDQYICIGIERPAGNVHTAIDVVESFAAERGIEIGGEQ